MSLPNEVLDLIGQFMVWDKESLHTLTLSCRAYFRIFNRYIYSIVNLHNFLVAENLFKTLHSKPDLGEKIRILIIPGYYWREDPPERTVFLPVHMPTLPPDVLYSIVEDLSQDENDREKWDRQFQEGSWGTWAAVLLTNMRMLETISVEYNIEEEQSSRFQEMFSRASRGEKPFDDGKGFSRLKSVYLATQHDHYLDMVTTTVAVPILTLGSLRKISGYLLIDTDRATPFDKRGFPVTTLTVTDIELDHCLDYKDVADLVAACVRLQSFRFSWGYDDADKTIWDFKSTLNALAPATSTLQTLCLDWPYPPQAFYYDESRRIFNPGVSFAHFDNLRIFHIRMAYLISHEEDRDVFNFGSPSGMLGDLLPHSLEELIVCSCDDDEDAFQLFIQQGLRDLCDSGSHSKMQKITLHDIPVKSGKLMEPVSNVCQNKAIELYYMEQCCYNCHLHQSHGRSTYQPYPLGILSDPSSP